MKKIISYLIAWSAFWLGHIAWLLTDRAQIKSMFGVYQFFMRISFSIEVWAGTAHVWGAPQDKIEVDEDM